MGYQPTAYYGNISSLASAGGLIGPPSTTQYSGHTPTPQSRSASLGVQQNIGFGSVLDVSYQGTWGINRNILVNANPVPLYADFNPVYGDPTAATTNPTQPQHLPSVFQRPNYPGFGNINVQSFFGRSNYHGLQTALRHRLQHGLTFGVSYTWSRMMGIFTLDELLSLQDNRSRYYGPQGADRRQVAGINYSYDLPKPGHLLHFKPLSAVAANWNLSGLTGLSTGAPFTPGFSTTNALDITGSASEGARINVVGNPYANIPQGTPGLPHGRQYFNPAAFAEPAIGTIGNAGTNVMYGPGFVNWDMTLSRRIPLGRESRSLQIKMEAFNVFNHPQFTGVNSGYIFNAQGVNTNANLGALTGERGPRVIALELRLQF